MSVQSETRLVGSTTGLLPRVNLLPPEIAEQRTFQRIQIGLGVGLAASVALVGVLFMQASHSVDDAQSSVDAAQSQGVALQAQNAKYSDVTATYAKATAAQVELTTAMGDEIRFSQMLNDLSMTIPSTVWLKTLAYTTTPAVASATAGATAPASTGTFAVTGRGYSHDDTALWIDALSKLSTLSNPYFNSSTEVVEGKRLTDFTSTASLTAKAQSGRYVNKVGG